MVKVLVLYYSAFSHIHQLAQAIAEGARTVSGAQVTVRRVPETLPTEVQEKMGIRDMQRKLDAEVPVMRDANELANYDCIIFGTPTRFGNMCGQMRQFLDATGKLWATNALKDKVASVFTSSNTQHGGQESTILSFHITLLHHGFLIAGLPYEFQGQSGTELVAGCSPYGASTIAGKDGKRHPEQAELDGARFQGRRTAQLAADLLAGRQSRGQTPTGSVPIRAGEASTASRTAKQWGQQRRALPPALLSDIKHSAIGRLHHVRAPLPRYGHVLFDSGDKRGLQLVQLERANAGRPLSFGGGGTHIAKIPRSFGSSQRAPFLRVGRYVPKQRSVATWIWDDDAGRWLRASEQHA